MRDRNIDYATALALARDSRKVVRPNAGFARELRKYQEELGLPVAFVSADDTAREEQEIEDYETAKRIQEEEMLSVEPRGRKIEYGCGQGCWSVP